MENEAVLHDHGAAISEHLRDNVAKTESFRTVSDIFKLLADSSRVRIFWLLCHCEQCVVNISILTDMTSPAVSHHLRQLRDSGLIVSRRDGKEVYYKTAIFKAYRSCRSLTPQPAARADTPPSSSTPYAACTIF